MKKISRENRQKVNSVYNQCVIYSLIMGALSVPFLFPAQVKPVKKPNINNIIAVNSPAPAQILSPPVAGHAEAQPAQILSLPTAGHAEAQIANEITAANAAMLFKKSQVGLVQILMPTKSQSFAKSILQPKIIIPVETKSLVPVAGKPSTKTNVKITIQNTKINREFLHRMEGSILKGYVPLPKTTKSGVTIASGFDVGQLNLQAFNKLPISDALKAKLKPYVGLKKFAAVNYLKAHPLTITPAEMQELNNVAANMILQPLVKSYDKASKTPFVDLPPEAQTALFSFAYQYGSGFMYKSGTRQLWNYYVAQNWSKVKQTLHSFKLYAPRRRQEAKLINELAINS